MLPEGLFGWIDLVHNVGAYGFVEIVQCFDVFEEDVFFFFVNACLQMCSCLTANEKLVFRFDVIVGSEVNCHQSTLIEC